jgi:IS4 transposase
VRAHLHAGDAAPWLAGYEVRVLDGNHLPASEKRLQPLRRLAAAPLPGLALVLYAPELDLVIDVLPGEDAHAQEQTFVPPLLERARPGELWIADRNFATRSILAALIARGAAVLMREHAGHPVLTPRGARRCVGRGETGVVYERGVDCPPPTPHPHRPAFQLREIEVELDTPLESGETVLRLLTTLPDAVDAITIAALYRRRWTVEGMFQRLEAVLHSEVRTFGQPRAALLAFCVAIVAYNVLAVVQAAVAAEAHARARPGDAPVPLSMYYVAHDVREHYRGLLIAVAAAVWTRYARQRPAQLARTLRRIAAQVRLEAFRKHPRAPKRHARQRPKQRDGPPSTGSPHVATARILQQLKQRPPTP